MNQKFASNKLNFVKPLYLKKVNNKIKRDAIKTTDNKVLTIDFDSQINLRGRAADIKPKLNDTCIKLNSNHKCDLPGACDKKLSKVFHKFKYINERNPKSCVVSNIANKTNTKRNNNFINKPINNLMQDTNNDEFDTVGHSKRSKANNDANNIENNLSINRWLRMVPVSKTKEDSLCEYYLRCVFSQLGLITFLVIWTSTAVFVINYFEESYEEIVSKDFARKQNQLVIDLATELRQITPILPKWKLAIEKRLDDERMLTMQAIGSGARLLPASYWDITGTFLFTIYAMTALGFGAPVPQTVGGRMSALIYASLSIPIHLYLMINLSRCLVAYVDRLHRHAQKKYSKNESVQNKFSNTNIPKIDEKKATDCIKFVKLIKCLRILFAGRGVPLAVILYYAIGAIVFGVLRDKALLDVVMFPLNFTTTGGLENVAGHVRVVYGFYVEGVMFLFACVIATIQRCSYGTLDKFMYRHRLYYYYDNKT